MPRDCCVALPCGAMGLSSVCDCDIFCSFSLTIFKSVMNDNAPVICNHGSLPLRRVGESWANVPYFYLCIVSIVWGKCLGVDIPRQTWQCNVIHDSMRGGGGGGLPCFYQMSVPTVWGYSRELQTKCQSPCCSPGLGTVVTNDYCCLVHNC